MGYAFSNRAVFRVGRKAFAAALLGTTAFAVLLPATMGPATAQSAQISFNIPAGPLSQAITAYGRQGFRSRSWPPRPPARRPPASAEPPRAKARCRGSCPARG